jgi:HEAT repeat protein
MSVDLLRSWRTNFAALLLFGFVLTSLGRAAPDENGPALRYAWKTGEEHAFQVKITIDRDDQEETHSGTPSYKVMAADDDGIKLQFLGGVNKTTKMKVQPGAFPRFPGPPPFPRDPFGPPGFSGARTLTINERGRVITEEGNSQLPYLLGDLAQMILIPLPKTSEKSWTIQRETNITVSESNGFRHPFFDRREKKNVRAEEESIYAIAKTEGDVVTIKESYSLQSLEQVKKKPTMEMVGDATILFDTKLGGPTSYESNLSLVLREGNTTTEIPITVSLKRVDPAELEASRKAAAEAAAKAKADAEAEMHKPLSPAELAGLIDDLNSDDKDRAKKALDQLAKKIPPEPDPKVSVAIDRFVTHDDFWVRKSAISALEKWATKDSVPALLSALEDKDVFHRAAAIGAISKFPSQEVADGLAALLADNFSRGKAAEVLQTMGEMAEEPSLPHLKSKDFVTQMETCKVLGAVGGERSLKALEPLASGSNGLVEREAKQAIEKIKKRLAMK